MKTRYWSCSKLADYIRGTDKLGAATSEEWAAWDEKASNDHPFRYWVAETALGKLQNFISSPIDGLYSVKYYCMNRWISRTHALTSGSLAKGQYHEIDTRILHCLFDELVNYVEVEVASSNISWNPENRVKYSYPFHAFGRWKLRWWRSAAAGIDHLNWSSTLTYNDDWVSKDDPKYGLPTDQAISAIAVLEMYTWWKVTRLARTDPHETSGWSALCEEKRKNGKPADYDIQCKITLDLCAAIELQYNTEDTEMLVKLINIRSNLWT